MRLSKVSSSPLASHAVDLTPPKRSCAPSRDTLQKSQSNDASAKKEPVKQEKGFYAWLRRILTAIWDCLCCKWAEEAANSDHVNVLMQKRTLPDMDLCNYFDTFDKYMAYLQGKRDEGKTIVMHNITHIGLADLTTAQKKLLLKHIAEGVFPRLQTLNLEKDDSSADNITEEELLAALEKLPLLRSVNLQGNHLLTDRTLDSLKRNCKFIQFLHLGRNCVVPAHTIAFSPEKIHELTSSLTNLNLLELEGCQEMTTAYLIAIFKKAPKLRHLTLTSQPQFNDAAARALAQHCKELRHLSLREIHTLTPEGLQPLVPMLKKHSGVRIEKCNNLPDQSF